MKREQWDTLTGKNQWDVFVALRGPDISHSETLKYFTTGVIRNSMSGVIRVGGQLSHLDFVCLPNGRVFKPEIDPVNGKPAVDLNHFIQHVGEAANVLDVPMVCIPPDLWEKMVLTSYSEAMKILTVWALEHEDQLPEKVAKRLKKSTAVFQGKEIYP